MAINQPGQPAPEAPTTMTAAFGRAAASAAPATAAPSAQRPTAQAAATMTQRQFSFSELGALSNAGIGRTPASEVLTKLQKALGEIYDNADKTFEIVLIPVDMNNNPTISVSALVVAVREPQNPDLGVSFHTLILEGSIEPIPPRYEQIQGKQVEVLRMVTEADDQRLDRVVVEHVVRQFPNSKPISAYSTVVPRDLFRVEDKTQVWHLAESSLSAAVTELNIRRPGFQDLDLTLASKDDTLTVRTFFSNAQIKNAVGHPLRADFTIDLAASSAQGNQQQSLERTSLVSRVTGYTDLVWDPVAPPVNQYQMQMPQTGPVATQRYIARTVFTSMETISLRTIPSQLLALLAGASIADNNGWMQSFRPQGFGDSKIDLRDIGAIGYEMNLNGDPSGYGERIDTKSNSFTPANLPQLIAVAIRPGTIITLHVAVGGPDNWMNNVFAAAAQGSRAANDAIIDGANYLTGGHFVNRFPNGGRVALTETNMIHLGYYHDETGTLRDIRDLDHLAVLNLVGAKDPSIARAWSDTFLQTNYDLKMRMSERKKIISALFPDATFTGFAVPVTFEQAFIQALSEAARDAGLDVRSVVPYADSAQYERATAQYVSSTLLSAAPNPVFSRGGYGGFQAAAVDQSRAFAPQGARWGR